ncbi:MAG TPA: tetratricopeptide repeat protein [Allosphingosinicella sp.]
MAVSTPARAQNSGSLVEQARQAAQQNRNRESADLFQRALEAEPAARDKILREYADQLTYSDRAAEAVPLYREVLARPAPTAEERLRAMRGLALSLAWSGQHAAAVEAYTAVLREKPDDVDALTGRGRVQIWRRRYGEAEADFRRALAVQPGHAEAIRGLAEAQSFRGHQREALATLDRLEPAQRDADALLLRARTENWAGRPDLADSTLRQALELRPRDEAGARLARELEIARSPLTEVSAQVATQSDDTDFARLSAAQTFFPGKGAASVSAGYDLFLFRSENGPAIDIHRPFAAVRLRLSDWAGINARAELTREEEPGQTDEFLTYNVFATLAPSDRLRFDFGVDRATLDNIRSMLLDVRTTSYSGSVDFGSDAGLKASLRGSLSDFSDGNRRRWGQIELRQRLAWKPNVFAGLRYTTFRFSKLLDNGYFNPRDLQSLEAVGQVWGRSGRFYYSLRGSVGRENADPGRARSIYSAEGRLTRLLTDRLEIEGFVNSFSSRAGAPGGFSRTTAGLALRLRW